MFKSQKVIHLKEHLLLTYSAFTGVSSIWIGAVTLITDTCSVISTKITAIVTTNLKFYTTTGHHIYVQYVQYKVYTTMLQGKKHRMNDVYMCNRLVSQDLPENPKGHEQNPS